MSHVLPTAAHLELLRRLEEWHLGEPLGPRLVDLVRTTPAAGRGEPEPSEDLSARELLRVAVPALANAAAAFATSGVSRTAKRARRPRTQRVIGSSAQADAVRAALPAPRRLARGPVVLVVGGPLEAMFGGVWSERVSAGSGVRWRRMWSRAQARAALPALVDLERVVATQLAAVGERRVHLVLAGTPDEAVTLAASALGLVPRPSGTESARSPVATDLLRRVNQVTAMRLPTPQREQVRQVLDELIGAGTVTSGLGSAQAPDVLGVPDAYRSWASRRASQLAMALRGSACAVHGDPAVVVPSSSEKRASSVTPEQTLRVAGEALWRLTAASGVGGDPWRTG